MTIVLIFSSFTVLTASAEDVSYSVTSVAGKKGDTVTVSVKLSSTVDIWGANVMLGYNSSELEFVKCAAGDITSTGSLHNTGSSVNYSGMFTKKSGVVFTATFKILKSSGTSTLKLESTENTDKNGKVYTCNVTQGKVTVLDKSVILGDLNGDKKVTAADSRMILQHVAGIKTFSQSQVQIADLNGDGSATAVDARIVLQMVAGLIK